MHDNAPHRRRGKRPPAERREIAQAVHTLLDTHNKTDAYRIAADRYDLSTTTVAAIYRKTEIKPTQPTQPSPMIYAPFIHTDRANPNIELTRDVTRLVFISDVHWHPEHSQGHDPAAYECALRMMQQIDPQIIFFGGDIVDCYAPSRYDKVPRLATPEAFEGEIYFAKTEVARMRAMFPDAKMLWLTGNHELRLPRSVAANAPWLAARLQNIEGELDLTQFEIQFVYDGHRVGKLHFFHGHDNPGAGRVNTAKNKFERGLRNMMFGHHHKFSKWFQANPEGGYHGAFGNGTLHWLTAEYARHPDWTQGFSVVDFSRSGLFQVDQIPIHKPSIFSPRAEMLYQGVHVAVNMETNNEK